MPKFVLQSYCENLNTLMGKKIRGSAPKTAGGTAVSALDSLLRKDAHEIIETILSETQGNAASFTIQDFRLIMQKLKEEHRKLAVTNHLSALKLSSLSSEVDATKDKLKSSVQLLATIKTENSAIEAKNVKLDSLSQQLSGRMEAAEKKTLALVETERKAREQQSSAFSEAIKQISATLEHLGQRRERITAENVKLKHQLPECLAEFDAEQARDKKRQDKQRKEEQKKAKADAKAETQTETKAEVRNKGKGKGKSGAKAQAKPQAVKESAEAGVTFGVDAGEARKYISVGKDSIDHSGTEGEAVGAVLGEEESEAEPAASSRPTALEEGQHTINHSRGTMTGSGHPTSDEVVDTGDAGVEKATEAELEVEAGAEVEPSSDMLRAEEQQQEQCRQKEQEALQQREAEQQAREQECDSMEAEDMRAKLEALQQREQDMRVTASKYSALFDAFQGQLQQVNSVFKARQAAVASLSKEAGALEQARAQAVGHTRSCVASARAALEAREQQLQEKEHLARRSDQCRALLEMLQKQLETDTNASTTSSHSNVASVVERER